MIYLLRHGQSEANKLHAYSTIQDPLLTVYGINKAVELRDKINEIKFDIILCSPLQRALQTALLASNNNVPIIVYPTMHEHQATLSDKGSKKSKLMALYDDKRIDFTLVDKEEWALDNNGKVYESQISLMERVNEFLKFVKQYEEKNVLAVGHGKFFSKIIGRKLNNCELIKLDK